MNIFIPPEALEAGARELLRECNLQSVIVCRDAARAAFLAMVEAWPGMHTHEWQRPWLGGMSGTDLILPLTQEPSDG